MRVPVSSHIHLADAALTQRQPRSSLISIDLTAHLRQLRRVRTRVSQQRKATGRGLDRVQLSRIPGQDDLRPSLTPRLDDPRQIRGTHHAGLIHEHDRSRRPSVPAGFDPGSHRRDR